ncbi:unnamed protein product [Oppiella nova]|uniref:Uncharacterized protein n=1 Tax=Oppiella nova TaxID=334625 RepID=A0A7R9QKM6_9ACAR|nr:unnamed protein product [Oppiella nova]CAG2166881.1 unnamed protein product [Oppiella nova]
MISRSLGAEAGSMIGIIFSFANAVLVSANLIGAAETAVEIMGANDIMLTNSVINDTRLIGALLLILIAIIPLIGMSWEARAMLLLMVLLFASLVNYFVGTFIPPSEEKISKVTVAEKNIYPNWGDVGFFDVFGVFFPSVIGIFAGASMSGDLKDPNAAIPKVYLVLITMTLSSGYGPLVWIGIFAATLSSALGSYVCAPRIFQALCEDNLFPYIKYFAKGYGKINDPRRGYILTFVIALAFIAIGELNTIAPIISNFFMASFFLVNIASFHASFVGSPSFRPTFKYYNQWVSLLAAVFCIVIMFLLDYITAIVTVVIMGVIYLWMMKKGPDVNWGTSKRAHIYNSALTAALKLNSIGDHVKNFRPSILLMTGYKSSWRDCLPNDLIDYYSVILFALENELSVMILRIQEGLDYADFFESDAVKTNKHILPTISEPNDSLEIENGMTANIAVNVENMDKRKHMDAIKGLIPNDAIEAMNQFNEKQRRGTIDIWLLADDGGLTIMVPYLLSCKDIWRDCSLRILTLAANGEEITETKDNLSQLMSKLRIPFSDIKVLVFSEADLDINDSRTLPMANKHIPIPLYMSWLEVLTDLTETETDHFYRMPPFLMLRGFGQRVITI